MAKEWLLITVITLHHPFFGHLVNSLVIVLDLGIFFGSYAPSGKYFGQKKNNLGFPTMTSKKMVQSYYYLSMLVMPFYHWLAECI